MQLTDTTYHRFFLKFLEVGVSWPGMVIFISSFIRCISIAIESLSLSSKLLTYCIMSATYLSRGFSDTSLQCGKSTNARIPQIILLLKNLSKSCINDHKLKWAAKEVTS